MTLAEIFQTYTAGSAGFVKAVSSHCGFDMSNEQIAATARAAWAANIDDADGAAAEFERLWNEGGERDTPSQKAKMRIDFNATKAAIVRFVDSLPRELRFDQEGAAADIMIGVCNDVLRGVYEIDAENDRTGLIGFCSSRGLLIEENA